eukprot:TRINITY_DN23420_c0_g1_i1.p1 TRINITY_DN23420_c0_g1~~TRINITY_DN23420_c0_g1_i1.p1  ORF type:complete len:644 (-),score=106.15 TRINITY_DN23420_c0_g1_i1:715-2646(-)
MAPAVDLTNSALSDDLLVNILRRMQARSQLESCSLVCKRWKLLLDNSCRALRILRVPVIPCVLLRYSNLRSLDCSLDIQLSDRDLVSIATTYNTNLQTLNLSNNKRVGYEGFSQLGQLCTQLTTLLLAYCTVTDASLMALSGCHKLEVLKLANCRDITDAGIFCLAAGCKGLRELSLRWCILVTNLGMAYVAANCTLLRSLDLGNSTKVTSDALESIALLPALEHLNLEQSEVNYDGLLALSKGCPKLKELDLRGCQNVTDAGVRAICAGVTDLEELALSYCLHITDAALTALSSLSRLRVLKLDKCALSNDGLAAVDLAGRACLQDLTLRRVEVGDQGLTSLLTGCSALKHLDLTCCPVEVTDVSLAFLAKTTRALERLFLEGCRGITSAGLAALAGTNKGLRHLDCTDSLLTDDGLKAISGFTQLEHLKLGFVEAMTDTGICHIAASCPSLTYIDLYRCEGVGDAGITALASGCPSLTEVNFSYTRMTDASLAALAASCPSLVNVETRNCPGVSHVGLASLAKGCPNLTDLDVKRCSGFGDEALKEVARRCSNLKQITMSYCPVTGAGFLALAGLPCLSNIKIIHVNGVAIQDLADGLLRMKGLKKLKILSRLREELPSHVLEVLYERGCNVRWMEKPEPT